MPWPTWAGDPALSRASAWVRARNAWSGGRARCGQVDRHRPGGQGQARRGLPLQPRRQLKEDVRRGTIRLAAGERLQPRATRALRGKRIRLPRRGQRLPRRSGRRLGSLGTCTHRRALYAGVAATRLTEAATPDMVQRPGLFDEAGRDEAKVLLGKRKPGRHSRCSTNHKPSPGNWQGGAATPGDGRRG